MVADRERRSEESRVERLSMNRVQAGFRLGKDLKLASAISRWIDGHRCYEAEKSWSCVESMAKSWETSEPGTSNQAMQVGS